MSKTARARAWLLASWRAPIHYRRLFLFTLANLGQVLFLYYLLGEDLQKLIDAVDEVLIRGMIST